MIIKNGEFLEDKDLHLFLYHQGLVQFRVQINIHLTERLLVRDLNEVTYVKIFGQLLSFI